MDKAKAEKQTPAQPPAPETKTVATNTYIVQDGDYLIKVAKAHRQSWQSLAKINKITSPYNLKTGQKLKLK